MQDIIGKLYDNIVSIEDDSIELGKRLDKIVEETIVPLRKTMSEDDVETIKEIIYKVVSVAERDGFRLGVNATATFVLEALVGVITTK